MEFFDSLIKAVSDLTNGLPKKEYSECTAWHDTGKSEIVLQRDTAFELDGVGFNLVTSCRVADGITVIGDDLGDIKKNQPFARISVIQIEDIGDEQKAYNLIKKLEYVKYHHFPEGYMIRTSSRSHKEIVRVAKSAVKGGIDFRKIGSLLIKKYKENPSVKGANIIFITDKNADYSEIEEVAKKNSSIAEALNHIMNNIKFDCDTCNLKPICDEVEGMKELHFKNAGMNC